MDRAWRRLVAKAAQMPEDKRKALLLKIRKGATSAITLTQWLAVIELVGGSWDIELGFVPLHDEKEPGEYRPVHHGGYGAALDWIEKQRTKYLTMQVSELPADPSPGQHVTAEVSPIQQPVPDSIYFTCLEWLAVYGIRVDMPDGESCLGMPHRYDIEKRPDDFLVDLSPRIYNYSVFRDIERWLMKETDFLDRVCQILDMEKHVPGAQRTRDNTGCCPVCFREMKLEPGAIPVMVAHGFRRPRHLRQHVGNCWGVGRQPYELTSIGCQDYIRAVLLPDLAETDEITKQIEEDFPDEYPHPFQYKTRVKRGDREFELGRQKSLDHWKDMRKAKVDHIRLYETFVAEWKPRDLPVEGGPPRLWINEIARKVSR
jgi:hypothetical protein